MRLTWKIIEAWRRGGNGRKGTMIAPQHLPNIENTLMSSFIEQIRKRKTSCSKNFLLNKNKKQGGKKKEEEEKKNGKRKKMKKNMKRKKKKVRK